MKLILTTRWVAIGKLMLFMWLLQWCSRETRNSSSSAVLHRRLHYQLIHSLLRNMSAQLQLWANMHVHWHFTGLLRYITAMWSFYFLHSTKGVAIAINHKKMMCKLLLHHQSDTFFKAYRIKGQYHQCNHNSSWVRSMWNRSLDGRSK